MWASFYLIIHELILLYIWGWILYGSHDEDKQVCGPLMRNGECQAIKWSKILGIFAKEQLPVSNECGSLIESQWVIKREMVFSTK